MSSSVLPCPFSIRQDKETTTMWTPHVVDAALPLLAIIFGASHSEPLVSVTGLWTTRFRRAGWPDQFAYQHNEICPLTRCISKRRLPGSWDIKNSISSHAYVQAKPRKIFFLVCLLCTDEGCRKEWECYLSFDIYGNPVSFQRRFTWDWISLLMAPVVTYQVCFA